MEEISAQEAAGSSGAQFQSLETQSEDLSPEPQFVQDTDMEQGLTGGKAETALTSRRLGAWRGFWTWCERPGTSVRSSTCSPGACSSPRGKPRRPGSCAPDSQVPGILLRLPTSRIHSVNSCPALSHTQASAFSGETLAVLSAGISKRWPKYRLPIDIARPCSETPFPRL
ncbi:hypothetical protein HPG69_002873 [Diceros bicornis minor]|uniref:Zinc finger protein 655 n=1 Tax=Diceros bicornis minor TaxID=77932 RepID=A0A7J7ERD0_DICBM|nr:hypothetical protein HPG69_002873 [Diceros bicornis minor]